MAKVTSSKTSSCYVWHGGRLVRAVLLKRSCVADRQPRAPRLRGPL